MRLQALERCDILRRSAAEMIKLLRINNIALIPSLQVELEPGLVLLTGETGAGKSIVIDALSLLLGERASPDLVRSGEERAAVEAVVEVGGACELLDERGLPSDGDEIVIRREIQATGKGRATINGALVPVSLLRDLAPSVAVIHGQHEPQGLLDPATHLDVLDQFIGSADEGRPIGEFFRDVRAAEAALEKQRNERRESERRREMLEYQATEIEQARLAAGEEEQLRAEKARQANAGRLAALSGEAFALLYDDEAAVLGRLGQVYRRVDELAEIDPDFLTYAAGKSEVLAPLEDLALRLRDYQETLEVSPGRLDEIESRLALLERLKKKYGATVEDVVGFGQRCRRELETLGTPEEQERLLVERRERLAAAYLERAQRVSKNRRAAAGELRRRVQAELTALAMEKTRFEVSFDPVDPEGGASDASAWTDRGLDRVEFLLSPNPGEELRPLARIASGGELSRLMLAIKSIVGRDAPGLTLVFDEVDAGIGGRVAEVVGRKLKAVAARRQVLCVTHLPQIAALADQHLAVRKEVAKGRTVTLVERLGEEARIEEVARMLGGETITATGRQHAREMLKQGLRG
jgi:DNA repair protein RecN (Recombination protein N)